MGSTLELIPLPGLPMVEPGDDLPGLISESISAGGLEMIRGDVLVIAQKIVSKSEGRYVHLKQVEVTARAEELARDSQKDPRLVQLILDESDEILRVRPGVIIAAHRNGYVLANAGIDRSNICSDADDPRVLLLPLDPDASARAISDALGARHGISPQVIINDSLGRAWRNGTVGIAIGTAGLDPLYNQIGGRDLFGNLLEVTEPAVADELAAAASLVMGQAAEACPVVLARGAKLAGSVAGSASLIRDKALDMFR